MVNFYKMDVHRPIYDRFPVLKYKVNTFQTHSKWSADKSSWMRKFIVKTEIELMTTRILQFAPNFGFEALRYIIFMYIKSLVGFSSERFRMSRPIWRNFAWSSASDQEFCKIMDGKHGDNTGICRFTNHWIEGSFQAVEFPHCCWTILNNLLTHHCQIFRFLLPKMNTVKAKKNYIWIDINSGELAKLPLKVFTKHCKLDQLQVMIYHGPRGKSEQSSKTVC